jgi:hypothetical protein
MANSLNVAVGPIRPSLRSLVVSATLGRRASMPSAQVPVAPA